MRSFSKKLAFVLAAAMVVTAFAPAASAKAADEMTINKASQTLYVNEGVNHKGAATLEDGLYGNVSEYDFYVKNKPADYKTAYTFAWSSSDEKIITVGKAGLTTAVAVGKADVICVVTEKATGKTTTLKTAVEVKANADSVEISNADVYEGTAVVAGDKVDLNRTMVDENGNETSKRGKYVTDYTRWIAEPATGVTIDQATGTFTFGEDAVAGTYELYCETYQSSKYTQATATSDVVTVEFTADNAFAVKQETVNSFTLLFETPVKALSSADVTVSRMLNTFEYNQAVKSVALAKDGLSATVTVFANFVDKVNYTIKVKGFDEAYTMVASIGKPVSMEIVALDGNGNVKNPAYLLTTGESTTISAIFRDAAGVVVPVTETVNYRLEKLSTTGEYYLAGKKLTIKKNTASAVVIAEYPGWFENGKRVGAFSDSAEFFAVDAEPILPVAVSAYSIQADSWNYGYTSNVMQVKDSGNKKLTFKLVQSNGQNGDYIYGKDGNGYGFAPITGATITFTALDKDICTVSSTGYLTAYKPGTASFYVNLETKNNNGTKETTPFAIITVEVQANSELNRVQLNNEALTVGTAAGFNTASTKLVGYDQYNSAFAINEATVNKVECLSDGYGDKAKLAAVIFGDLSEGVLNDWESWSAKVVVVNVDASKLVAAMDADKAPKAGEAATLYFRLTYNNSKTADIAITIQQPSGNAADDYVQISTSDSYKDVVRHADNKDAKKVSFEVFYMNNGVKVAEFNMAPAVDAASATEGSYYYTVLKDGQSIWVNGAVEFDGNNKVTVYPSSTKALSDRAAKAVTGSVVTYDGVGAGTYTLVVSKCYKEGTEKVLVAEFNSEIVVAVGDAGKYYISGDQRANVVEGISDATGNDYNAADAKKILECFNIKDRKGNDILDSNGKVKADYNYFVDYTAAAGTDSVYVKEITFYENVGGTDLVAYTVAIDTALDRK